MLSLRWVGQNLFLILSVVLLCLSFRAGQAADDARPYMLGVDDKIKITVFDEGNLSDVYSVASDGTISMPLIGTFPVEGLTIKQTEYLITDMLADGFLIAPSVAVEIDTYRPFYILGEVHVPGQYSYVNNMSALNAVALAGGFTYRAKQKEVKILRDPNSKDDYKIIPSTGLIKPGDVILIEERFF